MVSLGHSHAKIFNSAIPASALNDEDDDDDDEIDKETRDDERTGTRYNVSFLIINASS